MKQNPMADKNVLFIAYEFPPQGESGVQRSAKFVKYLPEFGYRPLVLTAAEEEITYVTDSTLLEDIRDTTVFRCQGYEHFLVRLPDKIRLLRRLVRFFLPPDRNILAWLPKAKRMALDIAKQYPIDCIYTTSYPFSSAILGRKLKQLLGVPWVADFRDPWTDDAVIFWPSKLHYLIEQGQERRVVEAADAMIVVTPTMKDIMVRKYPQWANKVHMICNGFDSQDLPTDNRVRRGPPLRIGYAGKLHEYDRQAVAGKPGPLSRFWLSKMAFRLSPTDLSTHSPYYLLHAVRALLDERPELEDKIRLSFAGIFRDRNVELVRELELEKIVSVKGYLPHAESLQLLTESDVLFLPLLSWKDGRRSYIYTGKIFEYLATKKPILAAVPEGDARDLIREARAGWCVDPHDVDAIKALLEDLIEKKMAGTLSVDLDDHVIARFDRREAAKKLAAIFDSLPRERSPRSDVR